MIEYYYKYMSEELKYSNTESFKLLIIKPHSISHLDWKNPMYVYDIVNNENVFVIDVHPSEYEKTVVKYLETHRFAEPFAKVEMIAETKQHLYEMMFLDDKDDNSITNELAELLSIAGTKIYGTVIISKTFLHEEDYNINEFDNISLNDISNILYERANTKVILYDADEEAYEEKEMFGNIGDFANDFFSENRYRVKKLEIGFLKHNINVWYTEDKYGILDVFGNILPDTARIDKMIVFTMFTDNARGNITLDEFNKIKFLSKKLEKYELPDEYLNDEKDNIGRTIIKNKYRILNEFYNKYKN
jgi:hypothetical protein